MLIVLSPIINWNKNELFFVKNRLLIKLLFLFMLLIIYFSIESIDINDFLVQNNYKYFAYATNIEKFENKYISIGVEQFYLMEQKN